MTSARPAPDWPADRAPDRPDTAFSFVSGLYTASMIAPITVFLAEPAVASRAGLALAVVSISAALVGAGMVGSARLPGLPQALGGTPWASLLVVAPLLGTASVLAGAALPSVRVSRWAMLFAAFAGFAAAFLGLVVVSMATTRYTAWVVDDASVEATWTAAWPRQSQHRLWLLAGAIVLAGAVTVVLGSVSDHYPVQLFGQVLVPVGAVIATAGRRVTYRASEHGLELRTALTRRLVPWEAFEGYREHEDAVVLVRPEPWHVSLRCDLAEIDDPSAVRAALEAHLDRRS